MGSWRPALLPHHRGRAWWPWGVTWGPGSWAGLWGAPGDWAGTVRAGGVLGILTKPVWYFADVCDRRLVAAKKNPPQFYCKIALTSMILQMALTLQVSVCVIWTWILRGISHKFSSMQDETLGMFVMWNRWLYLWRKLVRELQLCLIKQLTGCVSHLFWAVCSKIQNPNPGNS